MTKLLRLSLISTLWLSKVRSSFNFPRLPGRVRWASGDGEFADEIFTTPWQFPCSHPHSKFSWRKSYVKNSGWSRCSFRFGNVRCLVELSCSDKEISFFSSCPFLCSLHFEFSGTFWMKSDSISFPLSSRLCMLRSDKKKDEGSSCSNAPQ